VLGSATISAKQIGDRPVPLTNSWAQNLPGYFHEDLDPNLSSTEHLVSDLVEIPTQSHILKLVCSAGVTVYGKSEVETPFPALAMAWRHVLAMEGGAGTRTLHIQAGEMTMMQSVLPRDPTAFTGTARCVSTTYSGHIQPIDERCSYGSVGIDAGYTHITTNFTIIGVHSVNGDGSDSWYHWSGAMALRVLYERLVA
jgi:hypothetical protein